MTRVATLSVRILVRTYLAAEQNELATSWDPPTNFAKLENSPNWLKNPHRLWLENKIRRSGIPHIALSTISAEKQRQVGRTFPMNVALTSLGSSFRPCPGRSPRGFQRATGLGCFSTMRPSPKSDLTRAPLGGGYFEPPLSFSCDIF